MKNTDYCPPPLYLAHNKLTFKKHRHVKAADAEKQPTLPYKYGKRVMKLREKAKKITETNS